MTTITPSVTKNFIPSLAVTDAKNATEFNQVSDKLVSQHFANKTAQLHIEQTTKEQINQTNLPLLTPPTVEKDEQALIDCLTKLLPTVMNLLGITDAQLLSLFNKISATLRELNAKIRNNGDQLKITTLQSSEKVKDSKYTEAGSLLTSAIAGSSVFLSLGMRIAGAGISYKGLSQTSNNNVGTLQNSSLLAGNAISSLSNSISQIAQQPLASGEVKEQGNERILETEQQIHNATGETHQREENINDEVKKLIQILNKMIEYSQQTVSTISGNIRA
ncbi:hypothetical protein [Arsenophonus endosymbiont of Bemisia tabaci]|uniref:hypothetical protein n=1 Tax=Arsenophonus endosymbiont of Bemisia tabaci TaxID=536059 RepID=UPI0015F766F4|nr:hypothetical protein [Arsenophonus endosymbiont of Bemisia tabaci]CAA2930599.1 hypothetical protein ARSQ2_01732 [Arsenophonus endosymbiont of Bemisia tabaci Q2]